MAAMTAFSPSTASSSSTFFTAAPPAQLALTGRVCRTSNVFPTRSRTQLLVRAAVQTAKKPAEVKAPKAAESHQGTAAVTGRRTMVKRTAAAAAAALSMGASKRWEARAAAAATCQVSPTASGIGYCDSVIGSGIEAAKGMLIKAHYTGKLLNGSIFDSSYDRRKPLTFRIGVGEVIRGWDQGILGTSDIPPMKAGGKRTLKIPSDLAYGARGGGCRGGSCAIPPNSPLVFDVEFLGKA